MAENRVRSILKLNQKTYDELYSENKIFREGEPVICVIPAAKNAVQQEPCIMLKIGDGNTPFRSLPWVSGLAANVYDWALTPKKPSYSVEEIEGLEEQINKNKLTWTII